ncbi:MAG: hypothetical protein MK106_05540 [Mariniblastus sp.]|nr:hypothetical protein [Mariniblastus sp.]
MHGHHGFGLLHGGRHSRNANGASLYGQDGTPTPAFAYPYYTTRGPRDFLTDGCGQAPIAPYNPRTPLCLPSIGW